MYNHENVGILTLNSGDVPGSVRAQLRAVVGTTAALIYTETEDGQNNPPIGSRVTTSAGKVFKRIAAAGASTDWVEVGSGAVLDGVHLYVSKTGSDTTGNGSKDNPLASVTAAMALVTSAQKTILVGPGEYAEAGAIVWPIAVTGIKLIGVGNRFETVISAAAGDEVITLAPGVQTATFELTIQNIQIDHDTAGQDGIAVTNDDMTKKLNMYLGNVGFAGAAGDKAIVCTHGDTDNAIRIYWVGGNGDCESGIDLAQANDGDRFYADNIVIGGDDFDFGTDVAGTVRMRYCEIAYRIFTGGGTTNLCTLAWCLSNNSGTLAAAADADITTNSSVTGSVIVGT